MAFRDGSATEILTVTIHLGKLRSIDAATEMQLRSISHDSYDQFAEIFSSRYLQYRTLPLQFLTPKKSICPMTLPVRDMDGEWGAMLTQSAKVWTHRIRRPPFWLIVTALDRNRYLPVQKTPYYDPICSRPEPEKLVKRTWISGLRHWYAIPSSTSCVRQNYILNIAKNPVNFVLNFSWVIWLTLVSCHNG